MEKGGVKQSEEEIKGGIKRLLNRRKEGREREREREIN